MIPTNYNKKLGCTVISSACVLWQGDNISCIDMCNGDTVQDVINKLAVNLCNLNDQLNPLTYDLSCYNFGSCPPSSFHDLFQLVLNNICTLNSINGIQDGGTPDLSQFIIPLAECLQYDDNYGNHITTLPLYDDQHRDYLTLLGSAICTLQTTTSGISQDIVSLTNIVNNLQQTFINQQIQIPLITTYNGFKDQQFTNGIALWSYLLDYLQRYFIDVFVLFGQTATSTDTPTTLLQPTLLDSLYTFFASNGSGVCTGNSLSIDTTHKDIITTFGNILRYINDLRTAFNNYVCSACSNSTYISDMKFTAEYTNLNIITIKIYPVSGYTINGSYNIYSNNGISIDSNTFVNASPVVITSVGNFYSSAEFMWAHIKGCSTSTSTGITSSFEVLLRVENTFNYCGSVNVTNVSNPLISIE